MTTVLRGAALLSTLALVALPGVAGAATYFVDDTAGVDTAAGTSMGAAWRTTARVNMARFAPGDVVSYRRGGTFAGRLIVRQSGTAALPITFTAYGTGAAPILENPGGAAGQNVVNLQAASYVVIDGFLLRNTNVAGVEIDDTSTHDVVRNCEITNTGFGVTVYGTFNLVTRNYIHDLNMIVNTPVSVNNNDDYGATGAGAFGSDNEFSYNRFLHCVAPSFDYIVDGGAVEFYGNVNRVHVHHNYAEDTDGFSEFGGRPGDTTTDVRFDHNVAVLATDFVYMHNSGADGIAITNVRAENNTLIILTGMFPRAFGFSGVPAAGTFSARNNVIVLGPRGLVTAPAARAAYPHDHNVIYITDGTTDSGLVLDPTDRVADPRLVNLAGGDFRLTAPSPAVDRGAALGYTLDLDDHAIPYGAGPDIGAYEYSPPVAGDAGAADVVTSDVVSRDVTVVDAVVMDVVDVVSRDVANVDVPAPPRDVVVATDAGDAGDAGTPRDATVTADAGTDASAPGDVTPTGDSSDGARDVTPTGDVAVGADAAPDGGAVTPAQGCNCRTPPARRATGHGLALAALGAAVAGARRRRRARR